MELWEIIMIGIGLSMDAVAVSMTNRMVYRSATFEQVLAMPLLFGAFQALMPLCGYYAGGLFADFLSRYSGILILIILGAIGGKMLLDGIRPEKEESSQASLTVKVLLAQAVATSIDAFAVGVGFSAMQVNILPAILVIGVTTCLCSVVALGVGKKFGDLLGNKAQVLGGIILMLIGVKAIM